jgi:hypothetical protein
MQQVDSVAPQDNFKAEFLKSYLAAGLGSLSRRDVDILVLHLLEKYGLCDGKPLRGLTNQHLSLELRSPINRIKTLRYEARLKFKADNEDQLKVNFLGILQKSELSAEGKKIMFVVEDMFVQKWLSGVVKDRGLVMDSSFNSEIVKIDPDAFCSLLEILYGEGQSSELRKKISDVTSKQGELTYAEVRNEFIKGFAGKLTEAGITALPLAVKTFLG